MKTTYLNNINNFRGIAIIFIVFGHCDSFGITRFNVNTTILAKIINSFIHGGTTFFVFISGFLFHYIYFKNFQFIRFLGKKIRYVLVPFLIFSSLDIFYYIIRYVFSCLFYMEKYEVYLNKIKSIDLVKIYIAGHSEINIALWYVPFIMVIFLFSKFYIKFIDINLKTQIWIISILMLLSLVIHRRYDDSISGIFQNVIYFTPVYLLGMFVSKNNKLLTGVIYGREFFVLILSMIVAGFQVKLGKLESIIEFKKICIKNLDLMIIQKSLLSIFFTTYLNKFGNKKFSLISLLAENSFGIFFIHGIFIWLFDVFILKFKITFTSNSVFIYFISSIIVLIISLLTTIFIRLILTKKSKYIVGC